MVDVYLQTRPVNAPATASPAPRACWWVARPAALPDGRLMGFLGIRVQNARDFYRAVRVEADDLVIRWELSKELPDGSFAEPYSTVIPSVGAAGRSACSCEGWRRYGGCRHERALIAALRSL